MFSFFRRESRDPKQLLRETLGEFQLPSFPASLMDALHQIRDPAASMASISETLQVDPKVSVSVLRMANSSAFSPVETVTNLAQALPLVGLARLESILLGVGVVQTLPRVSEGGYNFKAFWLAAAHRAEIARSLAEIICPTLESECFTAGLLQDMAVPFLVHAKPLEYGRVLERWNSEGGDLAALEKQEFPYDHAEVATWICQEWKMPENIASAIGGHHYRLGEESDYDCPLPVACGAHLRPGDTGSGVDELLERVHAEVEISEEDLRRILDTSLERAEAFAKRMG